MCSSDPLQSFKPASHTMGFLQFFLLAIAVAASAKPLSTDPATAVFTDLPVETKLAASSERGTSLTSDLSTAMAEIPANAIDITNTTLADKYRARLQADQTMSRSGCYQGTCPDYVLPFDLLLQVLVIDDGSGPYPGVPMFFEHFGGRVNDCGQCIYAQTGRDGCWGFTSCGRPQEICIDRGNARAHRRYYDNGDRKCYSIIGNSWSNCEAYDFTSVFSPNGEVACSW